LCIESNGNREEQYRTERLPHDLIDHNISFRRFLRKRIMPGRDLGATIKTLHWLARPGGFYRRRRLPRVLISSAAQPWFGKGEGRGGAGNPEVKLLFADSPISWPESAFEEGSPD
jgi:hypothetical protein